MTKDISTFTDEKLRADYTAVMKALTRTEMAMAAGQTHVANTSVTLARHRTELLEIVNFIEAEQTRRKEGL